jgi:hypothetical protein
MKIHLPVLPPPIMPPPPPKPAEQSVFMIEQAAHEEFERIKTQRQAQKMMRAVTRKDARRRDAPDDSEQASHRPGKALDIIA